MQCDFGAICNSYAKITHELSKTARDAHEKEKEYNCYNQDATVRLDKLLRSCSTKEQDTQQQEGSG